MHNHGMRAALDADSRRTPPPTERDIDLETIRESKTGPLGFEARDSLSRRVERLYDDQTRLHTLAASMHRIADVLDFLLHDMQDPGTEALCASYELRQLLVTLPPPSETTSPAVAFPTADTLRRQTWHDAITAAMKAVGDHPAPGPDPVEFYVGLLEDLTDAPIPTHTEA